MINCITCNCIAFFRWAVCPRGLPASLTALVLPWLMILVLSGPAARPLSGDDLDEARKRFWSGQYAECRDLAEVAILGGANLEDWYELLIECQLMTGRYADALDRVEAGMLAEPNSIRLEWLGYQVCLLNARPREAEELLADLEDKLRYRSWRYRDAANRIVQARLALKKRSDAKQVLDELLTPASRNAPGDGRPWLAIGELALANHDYAMAADHFRKAVELEPDNPAGHMGLAESFRNSEPVAANQSLQNALAIDPEHVPALLYLIDDRINSEQYDQAEQLIQRVLAVNPAHSDAWAYRAVLAHLNNDPEGEQEARDQAFGQWDSNPRVEYLIGRKLSQKYRFAEGARCQRRALELDPGYTLARMQLANDLLRLGGDEEGWELASQVYREDGYNVVAYNLVTLGREMADFRVLEQDGFIVRMHADEADIYGQRVLEILSRGKQLLTEKYNMQVAEPVFVEIFPDQKDFAIRTFGLPGGQGFLGVCFGRVITMNSPAARSGSPVNWESVLWHEFCHVVTLQKTGNRMPRWLSEGISVYEELQEDPTWGQVMIPRYREMILGPELTPVSQLSAAFLNPPSPEHLQFAYFQASLVVRFLIEQHGMETLHQVLDDLAIGMPINEVLGRRTGGIALLDKEFSEYARQLAGNLAPQMDWTLPAAGALETREACQQFLTEHPDNFYALRAAAALQMREGNDREEARRLLSRLAELYPGHRSDDNAWTWLAAMARSEGDPDRELECLEKSAALTADSLVVFERLLELYNERQDWPRVRQMARRVLAVDPLGPLAHENLARAAEASGQYDDALRPLKTLSEMDPVDPADVFYRYARALMETGDRNNARRQVLKCLEQAPRYKDAHRLLLELTGEITSAGNPPGPVAEAKSPAPEPDNRQDPDPQGP